MFSRNDSVEVQTDLAIDDPSKSFDQAGGLILGFAGFDNLIQWSAGRDGECTLVDGLVAGVKFGDDEMARCTERQHSGIVCIVVGAETGETWQQSMMQVENPSASELPASLSR